MIYGTAITSPMKTGLSLTPIFNQILAIKMSLFPKSKNINNANSSQNLAKNGSIDLTQKGEKENSGSQQRFVNQGLYKREREGKKERERKRERERERQKETDK